MPSKTRKLDLTTRRAIRDRLADFVARRYKNRMRMESDAGVAHSTAAAWFNPDPSTPDTVAAVSLARRKNLSLNWLLLGEGPELRGVEGSGDVWRIVRQTMIAELVSLGIPRDKADRALPDKATFFHLNALEALESWKRYEAKQRRKAAAGNSSVVE